MIQTSLSCFRKRPDQTAKYLTLYPFIATPITPKKAAVHSEIRRKVSYFALGADASARKSKLPVDFDPAPIDSH